VEPADGQTSWVLKFVVEESCNLTLTLKRGQGRAVRTLHQGFLEPGLYEVDLAIPRVSLQEPGRLFITLEAGDWEEKFPLVR
jgi:hypothetical protein